MKKRVLHGSAFRSGSSLFLMDQSKIEKLNLPETKYSMVIRLSVDLNPLAFLLTAEKTLLRPSMKALVTRSAAKLIIPSKCINMVFAAITMGAKISTPFLPLSDLPYNVLRDTTKKANT
jgi:hypothetical protein